MDAENATSSPEVLELRLHRFLIDSIAFMYEVDPIALKEAMSKSTLATRGDSKAPGSSTWSAVLSSDREGLLSLATLVSTTSEKVNKQHISSVSTADITFLNTHVSIPAKALLVNPGYAFRLLRLYAVHKGTNRYEAGHYLRKSRLFGGGWRLMNQDDIATRLLSDDFLTERIAPNEETKVLLGEAIARFGDKHWTDRSEPKKNRCLYGQVADVGLEKFIAERMAALENESL